MSEITVRVLDESEWQLFRQVRLTALRESPASFTATVAEEAEFEEEFWRERMTRSHRLLAERAGRQQGIVSLGAYDDEDAACEIFGLFVLPEARNTGVAWRLVDAAVALAAREGYRQAFYWVGTDNPRAIGFARNFGFGSTDLRREARPSDVALGGEEVALVLPLGIDTTSVPNPTSQRARPPQGPQH